MSLPSGARLGHYEILAPLGAGGMGEVYRAKDTRLERDVAIKVLSDELAADSESLARFDREVKALAALSHPNILTIHDFGVEGGVTYAVMELLEGEPLSAAIERGPLPADRAIEVAVDVVEGLEAAHSKEIIHRDLKPENIFITREGTAKILDFGLARHQTAGPKAKDFGETASEFSTTWGIVVGTIGYMSPEQVRMEPLDGRTDIFSFGCVLYEMLTGDRPFGRRSAGETFAAILKEDPPGLRTRGKGVPPALDRIVRRCLEKDLARRYPSARDLAADLKASSAKPGRASISLPRLLDRPRVKTYVTIAGLFAVALLAVLFLYTRRAPIRSLAVLPFANSGGDPNIDYLCDGITEELINNLSRLPGVKVMSRASVFRYKGRNADPRAIGSDLRVPAIVTGAVTQHGDDLAVSAELVDTHDSSQIWGQQYNRRLSDLSSIQEQISTAISEQLSLRLTGEQKLQLAKRQTDNPEAYQSYLKGRYYWNKRSQEGFVKAIEHFRLAIDADPAYGRAYAGLADCYALQGNFGLLAPRECMPKAEAAARKAIEIDEGLAEAHASLGGIRNWYDWDWPGAEKEFKRAIELNPNYATAHHWYSLYLTEMARHEEAVAEIRRAQELDPLSLVISAGVGWALYGARQYDRAIEQFRKTIEMEPAFQLSHEYLGDTLDASGNLSAAVSEYEKSVALAPHSPIALSSLGRAYARAGRIEDARRILAELEQPPSTGYAPPYYPALIYMGLGDNDRVFELLEKSADERSQRMVYLKIEPKLDGVRSDPRFSQLLRRVGFAP